MKHLRNQIFICEKDHQVGDNTFKVGQWYMSASACNDYISLIHNGKFIPVHGMDLLTNFKMVDSPEVLRYLLTMLEDTKHNSHLDEVCTMDVLDSITDGVKRTMNTYKTVAI
jgi:hypothetical protein